MRKTFWRLPLLSQGINDRHIGTLLALAILPSVTQAALVNQTIASGGTTTEWNDAIWGSPSAAPTATNTYRATAGLIGSSTTALGASVTGRVRAYAGANGSPTFGGGGLEMVAGTDLLIKDLSATYTVNLVLIGGVARLSQNSGSGSASLSGTINVAAESYLGVVQSAATTLTVGSSLTGSNLLHLAGGDGSGNTLVFSGDLSGFTGTFDMGGGNNIITVDFNQDYDLPNVRVIMGTRATSDKLRLDQNLKFASFVFGTNSLATNTVYSAGDLNTLFGNGSQFVDGGGTLSVYSTPLPPPATNPPRTNAPAEVKVVIIGDSTVANWSGDPEKRGWGRTIPGFFDPGVAFDNRAITGRSSKTFITQGDWATALAAFGTNDYVMIQFGHNDSHNPANVESTSPCATV